MSTRLQDLLTEIRSLEKDVEAELHRHHFENVFKIHAGKISFPKEILRLHRSFRTGLVRYLVNSNLLFVLTAPIIYSMVVPAFILDWFCRIFQTVCFPVYQIPKVNRHDYIRMDRHKLAYLNGIEKFNCDFCGYFNGTVAFAREVAARTEQYWCPIRHALRMKGTHSRYAGFVEFGNAQEYHAKLKQLRKELKEELKG